MKSASGTGNILTYIIAGIVILYAAITIGLGGKEGSETNPKRNTFKGEFAVFTGTTMGTTYTIKVANVLSSDEDDLQDAIDEKLSHVNGVMSAFDSSSEISMFNINGTTEWFPVSFELFSLLERAIEISKNTNRTFDITIGRLINLWGFGSDGERRTSPPSRREVKEVLRNSGLHLLRMKATPKSEATGVLSTKPKDMFGQDRETQETDKYYHIRRQSPDLYLDLGAIAKGYGVDQVAELIKNEGYSTFMVEIGGEILVRGSKVWRIAIENPTIIFKNEKLKQIHDKHNKEEECTEDEVEDKICKIEGSDAVTRAKHTSPPVIGKEPPLTEIKNKRETRKILEVSSGAIATSGDYRNFFTHKGRTYSHTINPTDGFPVEHNLRSVTVIHDNCTDADAIATALMVMGAKDGKNWANQNNIKAIFYAENNNKITVTHSKGAAELIE